MKNTSQYIADQVFNVNAYYTKKQNETKMLFFRCLTEQQSEEYFNKELSKIWDNIDHEFMDKQIDKLKEMVHENNVTEAINLGRFNEKYKDTLDWVIDDEFFKLVPESEFQKFEARFKRNTQKIYNNSKINVDRLHEDTYLNKTLENYNENVNQVITYFNKLQEPVRQVQLSSYLSMVHNTNLTRAGWNTTMGDADRIGSKYFIIPFHSFSCEYCFANQNKRLTKSAVERIIGREAKEQKGDLLHPNCKCTLSIYWDSSQKRPQEYTKEEADEIYHIRQKVNGLTLEKENLRTNMKIAESIGNQSEADKYRQRINAINRNIRDLKDQLPTEELRKQVTAIKR